MNIYFLLHLKLTSGRPKFVRLGPTRINENQGIDVNIADFIKHPDYQPAYKYNDIALLKLDRKISFNSYIRPACLPETYQPIINHAILIGYEIIDTEYEQRLTDALLKKTLSIYTHAECSDAYFQLASTFLPKGIVKESQICAGLRDFVETICSVRQNNWEFWNCWLVLFFVQIIFDYF